MHPACALPNFRHLEYFHDHDRIEHLLFDGVLTPVERCPASRPVAPWPGPRIQATGRRTLRRLKGTKTQERTSIDDHRDRDHADQRHRKEVKGPLFIDARPIAAELRRAIRGEVRFDAGSRALYATDGSNYRQVPIGVVIPHDIDDVIATVAVCRRHGAPILSRGGGTSLTGGCCNVAVVIDWSKHLNKVLCDRLRSEAGPGPAGNRARHPPHRGREAWPDVRPRPLDAHAQHPGRDDRQQLVRRPLADGPGDRADVRPGPRARHPALRRHAHDRRRHERRGAGADHPAPAAGRGRSTPRLKDLRDRYADEIRRRYPKDLPRRVSGYNLDDLLPEKGFHVARALSGTEGTCVTILEASLHLVPSPAFKSLLVLGYPDVYQRRRPRPGDPGGQADRPGRARRRPGRAT